MAVITGYRLTDFFKVNRKVCQGDVISFTIFTIWINPLLQHIKKKYEGYSLNNSHKIPILAFVDDLAIFTNNNKNM